MKFYKKKDGDEIFGFDDSQTVPDGLIEVDAEELDAVINPPKTEAQIKIEKKMEGVEFDGVMCSATSHDMWGLASIKDWIKSGQSVNFEFANGNKLKLDKKNVDDFESVWVPFRASFFE